MCHAAVFIIDKDFEDNHGIKWQKYVDKFAKHFPSLVITINHTYEYPIETITKHTLNDIIDSFLHSNENNSLLVTKFGSNTLFYGMNNIPEEDIIFLDFDIN
jgi:hypothetical protein